MPTFREAAEAFQAAIRTGEDAVKLLDGAEHRLINFQVAIRSIESDHAAAKQELALLQGAVQEAKSTLGQLTSDISRVAPQLAHAEATLARVHEEAQKITRDSEAARRLAREKDEEDQQRVRQADAALTKVLSDIQKLQELRDTLKAGLAQV